MPPKAKDHSGERFGRLVAESMTRDRNGLVAYVCLCECGSRVTVGYHLLAAQKTRSCGCLIGDTLREVWAAAKAAGLTTRRGQRRAHP
jgi:hypothetical protein